jgi:RNA polymerase sigma factor (TIGR02999 family)
MTTPDPSEITALLHAMSEGRPGAADALVPMVYDDLRALASRALRREAAGHTLQPTALVHEAFLRILDRSNSQFQNRSHFFAFAARIMRRVLVDQARARMTAKRSGGLRVTLDGLASDSAEDVERQTMQVIAVEEALTKLEQLDDRTARVVELRIFAGLSIQETAEALGTSPSTVKRDWLFARAFLKRELRSAVEDNG